MTVPGTLIPRPTAEVPARAGRPPIPASRPFRRSALPRLADVLAADVPLPALAPGDLVAVLDAGAYCALNLGLRHQDEFSVILAYEPYGTPGTSARWRLLGSSQARYRANSPIAYLPTMTFHQRLAVFLDAPAEDPGSLSDTLRVAHQLVARGQLVSLRVARGVGHTWLEARLELPYSLVFASQHLSAGGAQLA
jgi:enterochelin esterase-like enzyme